MLPVLPCQALSVFCVHSPHFGTQSERRFYLTEPNVDRPVIVTAKERAHPAIRKLARACIAIALLHLADQSTASASTPQQMEEPSASSQEVHHD